MKPLSKEDLMKMQEKEQIVNRLIELKKNGITYKKIAQEIGMNASTFRGWLSFRQKTMRNEYYEKLLEVVKKEQEYINE